MFPNVDLCGPWPYPAVEHRALLTEPGLTVSSAKNVTVGFEYDAGVDKRRLYLGFLYVCRFVAVAMGLARRQPRDVSKRSDIYLPLFRNYSYFIMCDLITVTMVELGDKRLIQ